MDSQRGHSSLGMGQTEKENGMPPQTATNPLDLKDESLAQEQEIDWQKVGRPYKKNAELNQVFDRELSRLKKALDVKLVSQDE